MPTEYFEFQVLTEVTQTKLAEICTTPLCVKPTWTDCFGEHKMLHSTS